MYSHGFNILCWSHEFVFKIPVLWNFLNVHTYHFIGLFYCFLQVKFSKYLTDPYQYIITLHGSYNVCLIDLCKKVFIIKVTVRENSFA